MAELQNRCQHDTGAFLYIESLYLWLSVIQYLILSIDIFTAQYLFKILSEAADVLEHTKDRSLVVTGLIIRLLVFSPLLSWPDDVIQHNQDLITSARLHKAYSNCPTKYHKMSRYVLEWGVGMTCSLFYKSYVLYDYIYTLPLWPLGTYIKNQSNDIPLSAWYTLQWHYLWCIKA